MTISRGSSSLRALLCGLLLAGLAARAEAAGPDLRLAIRPGSYTDALIDLGVQANVSILGASGCGPGGRVALSGRHTLKAALDRLLAGAPCRFEILDAATVRIVPAAIPRPPQRAVATPPSVLSEVVITATKRPARRDLLAAGVSSVARPQLDATQALDVAQVAGQMAGVLTTNLGPGRDKLLIRGLSDGAFTGRTRSTVGTYLDDAPINYNAPDPDIRLVDIDRIEVLRGPQGALYGSGAIAGVYRIVTRKPDLDRAAFGVSASAAWTKGGDPTRDIDGYASLPIVPGRAALRIVAYDEVQGGYLDDVKLRITNVDQTRRSGGRLALRWRMDDRWRFDALAASQHLRSNDTHYVTPGQAGGERANRVREAHNNDFAYGGATLLGEFDWGSVTSATSYVHHVFSSQFDATAALGQFEMRADDPAAYFEAIRSDLFVQDLVIRSTDAGRWTWLAGVYGARATERTRADLGILSPAKGATTAYAENRKDRLSEYAVYGEAAYELGGGWSVTLGGRLFQSRVRTTSALEVISPYGPRAFDQARTFEGVSPKLSLQRRFANGDLAYLLVSEGYRPGGFNSSGFFPIRAARSTFAPDRLTNYEAGVKLRRAQGRLSVRAAAYYDDWSNIQTDQYRPSGLAYTANVADARIFGIEAEIAYGWDFGLTVQANGLFADSRIRDSNRDFAGAVASALPGVPRTSGGLVAIYARPLDAGLTMRLVGEANYVGGSGLSFDASLPPRMGRYLRLRLSAEIAGDDWRFTAFVTNPLDEAGDTFAYGNPFSFGQVRQATPQRPRTIGLRLAATF